MKTYLKNLSATVLSLGLSYLSASAQTDGSARLQVGLGNYGTGSGTEHWVVVWITTPSESFIKTLRRQGPAITDNHWADHCGIWWDAKEAAGNNVVDGVTGATVANYSGNPLSVTWNGRDAANNLMSDGDYVFWVQYAENSGQGPYTTTGLSWTKGPVGTTNAYPNQSVNFTNMVVVWTPVPPARFTSVQLNGTNLVMNGVGPTNKTYYVLAATNISQSVTQWTRIATNSINSGGNFSFTNPVAPSRPQRFYLLQLP
jgi:hypothetical protein